MTATGAALGSSCGFSTRISLRWVPEPPEETTNTIVLSVGDWFVDLRMDKKTGDIDWAMAGTRIEENPNQRPLKVSFTRELDSLDEIGIVDIANFSLLPNGYELETGEMPRTDLPGAPMTAFEEVWQELPFRGGPEGVKQGVSWILESDDGAFNLETEPEGKKTVVKTFLGRIWGTYLALQQSQTHSLQKDSNGNHTVKKTGATVSARREEWTDSRWEDVYVVGPDVLSVPSMKTGLEGECKGSWRAPGEKVVIDGKSFTVRAFEEIL
ncbi:hypothetical protein N7462_000669 [Penicillium macrosclerotiorum]|uniref:uncharacterized protein n=1 Tax=Penicillium macrosclerotiorum TaxID=303699 RepID=UPI0025487EA3|nr:uncharacterized protein N7462_000669 [Penicillium macrosclerotiorum]KAJ5698664.1 hypothetical protein N7462_000669 [Penicillium macrosclerotiorum]